MACLQPQRTVVCACGELSAAHECGLACRHVALPSLVPTPMAGVAWCSSALSPTTPQRPTPLLPTARPAPPLHKAPPGQALAPAPAASVVVVLAAEGAGTAWPLATSPTMPATQTRSCGQWPGCRSATCVVRVALDAGVLGTPVGASGAGPPGECALHCTVCVASQGGGGGGSAMLPKAYCPAIWTHSSNGTQRCCSAALWCWAYFSGMMAAARGSAAPCRIPTTQPSPTPHPATARC